MAQSRQLGLRLDESDKSNLRRIAQRDEQSRIFSEILSVCMFEPLMSKGNLSIP